MRRSAISRHGSTPSEIKPRRLEGGAFRPFFLVCAHAGLKTGEDGPTHADPQSLQLLQDNFPLGTMITLTPWDPQEMWFLVSAALSRRPAVIAPFVTRPAEMVLDRAALGCHWHLQPPKVSLVYDRRPDARGTIVLQGTGVTNAFVTETLPLLDRERSSLNVYVITSWELFDMLPLAERARIFPGSAPAGGNGQITDFTFATMTRWIRSDYGRVIPSILFRHKHFFGSGSGAMVMTEAGFDGVGQFEAIRSYIRER